MRYLIIPLCLLCPLVHAEADLTKRPQPIEMSKRTLEYRSFRVDGDITDLFSNKELPRFTKENLPEQLKVYDPKRHTFINLLQLAQPTQNGYRLGPKEWIAFDTHTSRLHCFVDAKLAALFRSRFVSPPLAQAKIQGRLVSVKRQKDPFAQWSLKQIEAASPKELLSFNLITRSGEKSSLRSTDKNKHPLEIELEPTLSEDGSLIDFRFAIYNDEQSGPHQGLDYNSGLTLKTGHTFIQPYGISTDPERLTVLILRPDIINEKGEIVSPQE